MGQEKDPFMVRDDWQERHIGTHLIDGLIEVAREQGIEGSRADVLVSNPRMMHVFHRCAPGPIQSRMENTSYPITFALAPEEGPDPGRPTGEGWGGDQAVPELRYPVVFRRDVHYIDRLPRHAFSPLDRVPKTGAPAVRRNAAAYRSPRG
ncbi:MAG: GNAT family N-acetyltransferase [Candidatus Latescibacteria bacterium]|jgi:hypothetical protein|nr:GNAT family N-acetyltransferase [Candidatus Latescibacterota bacterium]